MSEQAVRQMLARMAKLHGMKMSDEYTYGYALGFVDGYFDMIKPIDPSASTLAVLEGYVKGVHEGYKAKEL
jgi:hypothetical protein